MKRTGELKMKTSLVELPSEILNSYLIIFDQLKKESGHGIAPELKENGLRAIFAYWLKGQQIIQAIKRTEEKLSLPERITPSSMNSPTKRIYTLEGVVDVISLNQKVILYDIKTYDHDNIQNSEVIDEISKQLNVYVHIWEGLNKNSEDFKEVQEIGLILVSLPSELKKIIKEFFPELNLELAKSNLDHYIEKLNAAIEIYEMEHLPSGKKWEVSRDLGLQKGDITDIINEFGSVIDDIVDHKFSPRPYTSKKSKNDEERGILQKIIVGVDEKGREKTQFFATRVCRNCDVRFSCESYQKYLFEKLGKGEKNSLVIKERTISKFLADSYKANLQQGHEDDDDIASEVEELSGEEFNRMDSVAKQMEIDEEIEYFTGSNVTTTSKTSNQPVAKKIAKKKTKRKSK